ncbi:hypothetical protein [uncultured Dokdonia sp.]|uniref:hypothetical protein n=1 Tax=uncultured Dokdonia sp. TaxID=575653 RepID=UPI002632A9B9|nr:hypothetical protein [uncultured Dokdonia sp.]
MLKNISTLGKTLNKKDQKNIQGGTGGGGGFYCETTGDCQNCPNIFDNNVLERLICASNVCIPATQL